MKEEQLYFSDSLPMEWMDADYQVTSREQEYISKKVYAVVRMKSVLPFVLPTVKIGKGAKRWLIDVSIEPDPPKYDDNFLTEDLDESRIEEKTFYPVYQHKDYHIAMTDQDSTINQKFFDMSLGTRTIRDFTGLMVDYREKVLWRGYDISGRGATAANPQGSIDHHVLGILNTSGIGAFDAGAGGDSIIADAGDAAASLAFGAADLIDGGYFGPYDMFFSPLVYKQFIANQNSTTHETDIQQLHRSTDIKGNKMLRNIDVSKHLIGAAETATTSNITLLDRRDPNGNPTIVIGEGYPISNLPFKQHAMAQSGLIVWSGCVAVIRPAAVTQDAAVKYA